MTSALTILLPLRGRHLHTLRFLWHANSCRMPYHFLVADGEVHPAIASLLEQPRVAFPNLDLEYIRYPNDETYRQFYRKMADASERVRTPYVMLADNDDFLVQSGIDHCVAFLQSNADFASCGGGVGGFRLGAARSAQMDQVTGRLQHVSFRFLEEYAAREDTAPSVAQRIRDAFGQIHTTYYNVFRSEALATIHRELAELDLSDLHLHEVYFGMRAVSLGKARSDGKVMSYMRQAGTGMSHAFRTDWAMHLVRSQFTPDLAAVACRMAGIVATLDGPSATDFAAEIRDLFGLKLGTYLRTHFGLPRRGVIRPIDRAKLWAHTVLPKQMVEALHRSRAREFLFEAIRSTGGPAAVFQKELTAIEALLSGDEFEQFVRHRGPALLHDFAAQSRDIAGVAAE